MRKYIAGTKLIGMKNFQRPIISSDGISPVNEGIIRVKFVCRLISFTEAVVLAV